ncbi:MAG: GTPase ObgE [Arenicella sp.]
MNFVDEAIITVKAGKGGNGALSFRREKYIPRGGPDGGDGGRGGTIYLTTTETLNTLADFRYVRHYEAQNGQVGMGRLKHGAAGDDLYIKVPVGTVVYDDDTDELIYDLVEKDKTVVIAHGGGGGMGNTQFKSSTNQAPRKITKGKVGDERALRLELKVLADVGLLGLPNAGKSTFLTAVSQARPKVANYPFTTLHPQLGVVSLGQGSSFVIADIPGLIEGASEGLGLGHQFLRHLSRTRLLLHIVDIAPYGAEVDLANEVETIAAELKKYEELTGTPLTDLPRWLVINKIDVLDEEAVDARVDDMLKTLDWDGKIYRISAVSRLGTQTICNDIMKMIQAEEAQKLEALEDAKRQAEVLQMQQLEKLNQQSNESVDDD